MAKSGTYTTGMNGGWGDLKIAFMTCRLEALSVRMYNCKIKIKNIQ